MILVVSTCRYRLSEEEFVRPIVEIVRGCGFECTVRRYDERLDVDDHSKVIVCGTALRDFDYLNHIENFECLIDFEGDVLGIRAGYQILAELYSNAMERIKKIGVYGVRVVKENPLIDENVRAYFLHTHALRSVNEKLEPLALQDDEVCMFKVKGKDFYGVSFHPEVLNVEILSNFLYL